MLDAETCTSCGSIIIRICSNCGYVAQLEARVSELATARRQLEARVAQLEGRAPTAPPADTAKQLAAAMLDVQRTWDAWQRAIDQLRKLKQDAIAELRAPGSRA